MALGIMNARTQITVRRIVFWNLDAALLTSSGHFKANIVHFMVIPLFDKFLLRLHPARFHGGKACPVEPHHAIFRPLKHLNKFSGF